MSYAFRLPETQQHKKVKHNELARIIEQRFTHYIVVVFSIADQTKHLGVGDGLVSFVVAAILLLKKKEHFKQWQLFFLVNGLFGVSVLQLIYTLFRIIN